MEATARKLLNMALKVVEDLPDEIPQPARDHIAYGIAVTAILDLIQCPHCAAHGAGKALGNLATGPYLNTHPESCSSWQDALQEVLNIVGGELAEHLDTQVAVAAEEMKH
jgi:hypothetical protein